MVIAFRVLRGLQGEDRVLAGEPLAGFLLTRYQDSFTPMIAFTGACLVTGAVIQTLPRAMIDRKILSKV